MDDLVLLEYRTAEGEAERSASLRDINRPDFDMKSHFTNDILTEIGNWIVANKTKSWGVNDLMVVDSGQKIRRSFDQFSREEIIELFKICLAGVDALKEMNVQKIFVGANINHDFQDNNEAFLRLHLHVLGLTKDDFAKMKEVKLDELVKNGLNRDLILDPAIDKFKKSLLGELNDIFGGALKYEFGIRFSLDNIDPEILADNIKIIDQKIAKVFSSLSYSLCLVIDSSKVHLNISPRSVFGKGVLESEGILLKRDKNIKFSTEQKKEKIEFLKKTYEKLSSKFADIKKGAYLKEKGEI